MTTTDSPVSDSERSKLASAAVNVTAPIPLLAFLGVIIEGIVGAIAFVAIDRDATAVLQTAAVATALALPVLLIALVYRLIAFYPWNLYAPREFRTAEDFIAVLARGRGGLTSFERDAGSLPFAPTDGATREQIAELELRARKWEPLLDAMSPDEFFALHSWYNEKQRYPMALVCLAIAIANGGVSSRNYSFLAANLRKLGRLGEAEASAQLALRLDPLNPDAHYNLAQTYALTGQRTEAQEHARKALTANPGAYVKRLPPNLHGEGRRRL